MIDVLLLLLLLWDRGVCCVLTSKITWRCACVVQECAFDGNRVEFFFLEA